MYITEKIENNFIPLLALSFSLFLLRSSIPYALYFFTLIQSLLITVVLIERPLSKTLVLLKTSIKSFWLFYLVIIMFGYSLILSSYNNVLFGDIVNVLVSISFIVLLFIKVNTISRFYLFRDYFIKIFSALFGLFLLMRFSLLAYNNDISSFFLTVTDFGDFDRNIYTLNLWLSIISVFYIIKNKQVSKFIIPLNIYTFLLLLLVFFSSSRRGIAVLVLVVILFIVYFIYSFLKKIDFFKKTRALFITIISSVFLLVIVINVSGSTRNKAFEYFGGDNINRKNISQTLIRYYQLYNPIITHGDFLKLLWGNDSSDVCFNEDNTIAINNVQEKWKISNNKEKLILEFTDSLGITLPKITEDNISYLPEMCKLPFTYTDFFSVADIQNIRIIDFQNFNSSFPFSFELIENNAEINMVLPALSESKYRLVFQIEALISPIDTLIIDNNSSITKQYNYTDGIHSYVYDFDIKNDSKQYLNIKLRLIGDNLKFKFSGFTWILVSSENNDSAINILSDIRIPISQFKYEQARSEFLWDYILKAEKVVSTKGYCKRDTKEMFSILNSLYSKLSPKNYSGSEIIYKKDKQFIVFNSKVNYPRFTFHIPAIQNTNVKIDLVYELKDSKNFLSLSSKRAPEINNVYFKSTVISDSVLQNIDGKIKRRVLLHIDSINSAQFLFNLGLQNLEANDTLILYDYKVSLEYYNRDSLFLSNAQYNFIRELDLQNENVQEEKYSIYEKDSLKQLSRTMQKEPYWYIDSKITNNDSSSRLELWVFGWQYFKSLSIWKKIFGDGFNYLRIYELKFGEKYRFGPTYSPHNPLISVLLSSGIIGAVIYLVFLLQIIYYYFKHRKLLGVFLIIYLIIFLYSFISGRTQFSIPYFVLFSIFPFLVRVIIRNESSTNLST